MHSRDEITFITRADAAAYLHKQLRRKHRLAIATIKRKHDPRTLVERVGDDMLEIAGSGQTVTRHALTLRGYTQLELSDRTLAAATDYANAKSVRQVA